MERIYSNHVIWRRKGGKRVKNDAIVTIAMHFYQVGQQLSTVYPLFSQFLCSRVTRLIGCRATIQQLQLQITYGRDSSVGRASDRNARHNTDTGSSPRCGKGLNFLHFILDSITKGRKVHVVKYKPVSADYCAQKKIKNQYQVLSQMKEKCTLSTTIPSQRLKTCTLQQQLWNCGTIACAEWHEIPVLWPFPRKSPVVP